MDAFGTRNCFLLVCLFVVVFPFAVWVSIFNKSPKLGCCAPVKSQRLAEVAKELSILEREFSRRVENWEYEFVTKENTNGYNTKILEKLIEVLVEVGEMLIIGQNSAELSTTTSIENTVEGLEKHISKLQTLDSLLMIKLQRKYSEAGLEETLPWMRLTRLPPGKTWHSLQTKESIRLNLVFFNNYSSKKLRQCLAYVTTSAAYSFLDHSVQCLFVLGKPRENPRRDNLKETLEVIGHVRFCEKIIWRVDMENVQVNGSSRSWWFIMESIFEKGSSQGTTKANGFFHPYKGDILFFEEDVILSEDVLEVAWFASLVKNTLTDIWQFGLGNEDGGNAVNAHPDTFIVRKAFRFLRNAYGFNVSMWRRLASLKTRLLEQDTEEWDIALGKTISQANNMRSFHVVIPTLARVHVPRENEKLPWSLDTRTIDLNLATVNKGIRDIYGFLCESSVLVPVDEVSEAECPCSSRRWDVKRSRKLYCSVQPFHVQDRCYSEKYLEVN